jgi:hypothetical protein
MGDKKYWQKDTVVISAIGILFGILNLIIIIVEKIK